MTRTNRGVRELVALVVALGLALGWTAAPPPTSAADPVATSLPAWDGSIDLYRKGVFTTQKSWLWCTAAGVQIVRNIVDEDEDHSVSSQRRYFNWMRERNRYSLPLSAGVDPQGWTAGLRHYVDDRYRLVTSTTFDNALRSAVKRLRLTGLPVALTVAHGNHGWILTGFEATADPSVTASFKVTSVRIAGPLYGLQSKNGYDMRPNTKLTPTQLKRYFTPWKYAPKAMIWDGRYVSIQPIPATTATSGAAAPNPAPEPSAATANGSAGAAAANDQATDQSTGTSNPPRAATEALPIPSAVVVGTPAMAVGSPDAGMTILAFIAIGSLAIVAGLVLRILNGSTMRRHPGPRIRAPG